ncbi:hypothetical protein Erwinia_phage_Fougasse_00062 [Erwinia phage Fougasse]|nr:hypothetical protein Erwinia_phage_Berlingot_00070 [Erwinia phage Berlingot]WJN63854.1 hypothetical protein Erwinia_phage_Calisson_00051 [Erwinia phage Calisson]WJN63955.1 hypothetical protein Erwinia_phage_Farigoule_00068 [Erwinia phage Farigoule]WJN64025.1 hypothetical protein Erwinia_phage_Fougasse_00062 [Erwinia phage Fougasse]WJN64113.1 hypothetical protein Erwinia_phage_Mauresque_00071 [Erwinia phage Mauresque]WJN64189.1 hypothetical protein Erwinia_phage_Navette_00069 [Erwinia phage 
MSSKLELYRAANRLIESIRYKHLVTGKVVADGPGVNLELDLTTDELSAILHQRANRLFHEIKQEQPCQDSTVNFKLTERNI